MASIGMAYIGMAYIGMTYIVMAYTVMAYIVMARGDLCAAEEEKEVEAKLQRTVVDEPRDEHTSCSALVVAL